MSYPAGWQLVQRPQGGGGELLLCKGPAPSIVEVLRGQADLISDLSPSLSLTTYQFRIKDLLSSHSSSFVSEIYGKVASHLLRA